LASCQALCAVLLVNGTILSTLWEDSLKELEALRLEARTAQCKQRRIVTGKSLHTSLRRSHSPRIFITGT